MLGLHELEHKVNLLPCLGESREHGSLVSIPSLHLMPISADPEIHPRSMGLDCPRLGDLLCTSLLVLR